MKHEYLDYVLILAGIGCLFLYFITSMPRPFMYELTTPLDLSIPLIPIFVIPYMSFHFFLMPATLAALFWQPNRYMLRVFLISFVVMLLLSNAIFVMFPTHFPLRAQLCDNSLLSQLIRFVYKMDNPCALCPSVHVNVSILCALMWLHIQSRFSHFMIFWAIMVALSTLFIRQHYVIDVIAGIITAYMCRYFGEQLTRKYMY